MRPVLFGSFELFSGAPAWIVSANRIHRTLLYRKVPCPWMKPSNPMNRFKVRCPRTLDAAEFNVLMFVGPPRASIFTCRPDGKHDQFDKGSLTKSNFDFKSKSKLVQSRNFSFSLSLFSSPPPPPSLPPLATFKFPSSTTIVGSCLSF